MGDAAVYCEVLPGKMIVYPRTRVTELGYEWPDHEINENKLT
jgi:hypothetical protein